MFNKNFLKSFNVSKAPQGIVNIKIMPFFISINYFGMLGTGWVNKVFSPRSFINIYLKNGNRHETNVSAFTNVPFRHNAACG